MLRGQAPDVLESLESQGVLKIPVDLGGRPHRFHSAVPLIRPWLAAGEPISPIRVMARPENSYRRLADGDGPVAGGVVLLGVRLVQDE